MVADIFFSFFLDCLIVLNLLLSSLSLFHISPSFNLSSSCFLAFLAVSSSFGFLAARRFLFFFFQFPFFLVCDFVKSQDWFLFEFAVFWMISNVVYRLFSEVLLSKHLLVLIRFEQDVEVAFQIDTTLFRHRVDVRERV